MLWGQWCNSPHASAVAPPSCCHSEPFLWLWLWGSWVVPGGSVVKMRVLAWFEPRQDSLWRIDCSSGLSQSPVSHWSKSWLHLQRGSSITWMRSRPNDQCLWCALQHGHDMDTTWTQHGHDVETLHCVESVIPISGSACDIKWGLSVCACVCVCVFEHPNFVVPFGAVTIKLYVSDAACKEEWTIFVLGSHDPQALLWRFSSVLLYLYSVCYNPNSL